MPRRWGRRAGSRFSSGRGLGNTPMPGRKRADLQIADTTSCTSSRARRKRDRAPASRWLASTASERLHRLKHESSFGHGSAVGKLADPATHVTALRHSGSPKPGSPHLPLVRLCHTRHNAQAYVAPAHLSKIACSRPLAGPAPNMLQTKTFSDSWLRHSLTNPAASIPNSLNPPFPLQQTRTRSLQLGKASIGNGAGMEDEE